MCPKGPIMSPYPHPSFIPIQDFKFSLVPSKIHFFSVFLIYIHIYVSYIYETYFFKISRTSAFRKVYMLWGYLLPLKSYSALKSCSERGAHFLFSHQYERLMSLISILNALAPSNSIWRKVYTKRNMKAFISSL